jgi:hypothetical protein
VKNFEPFAEIVGIALTPATAAVRANAKVASMVAFYAVYLKVE